MISALLSTWLVTQQWSWNKIATATSYRIYWGASGTAWCSRNRMEFDSATHCGVSAGCDNDNECCGDIPEPDFSPAFIVITAVNANGESSTEHGPVVTCP